MRFLTRQTLPCRFAFDGIAKQALEPQSTKARHRGVSFYIDNERWTHCSSLGSAGGTCAGFQADADTLARIALARPTSLLPPLGFATACGQELALALTVRWRGLGPTLAVENGARLAELLQGFGLQRAPILGHELRLLHDLDADGDELALEPLAILGRQLPNVRREVLKALARKRPDVLPDRGNECHLLHVIALHVPSI